MKLRKEKPRHDGRGDPFCPYCGTEMVWSTEWTSGFDSVTGKPLVYHQWVCRSWADNPTLHARAARYILVADPA